MFGFPEAWITFGNLHGNIICFVFCCFFYILKQVSSSSVVDENPPVLFFLQPHSTFQWNEWYWLKFCLNCSFKKWKPWHFSLQQKLMFCWSQLINLTIRLNSNVSPYSLFSGYFPKLADRNKHTHTHSQCHRSHPLFPAQAEADVYLNTVWIPFPPSSDFSHCSYFLTNA